MAIGGPGFDKSFKTSALIATQTSQYLVVGIEATSTAADATAYMANAGAALSSTQTARNALGVIQDVLSSTSDATTVRMFGTSKVKCAASIPAGAFIAAYEGASTTTFRGHVDELVIGTVLTATAARVIIGRAMESGSTNTVISAFINPAPFPIA